MIHKLFLFAGILFIILAIWSHHRRHFFIMHHRHSWSRRNFQKLMVRRISGKLNLTDEQKKKLDGVLTDMKAKHDSLCADREEIMRQVLVQVESDSLDEKALNELFQKKWTDIREIHPYMLGRISEFHGSLTSGQKQKLAGLIRKHYERAKWRCRN
ncbi:Spy/CpxP family protein refolding chaperone [bacterium]|nr:Spy/CpxP family protein refolding chaperone [bacterium]